ncbi:Metallo-dependent phosphatase-like protein [Pelagophyceae sp. CCMP2097]|nr:Metallo-dependent phosphatase-like protein [Pelagophyceae sp. CCMP2097]
MADDDVVSIVIATDNHLGFCDKDPVRAQDSFAAFEEILLNCKERKVDLLLLGGDLFHDNKPTRRSMHKTMQLLRTHALGDEPVSFQILSDQAANFPGSGGSRVNYEDPHISVSLPIFSIHGNHDDPTREGGVEALAALDVLAAASYVNYFGRSDKVDATEVMPILIKKGGTHVAIYGLGNMRDERLNRMWQQKKVKFLRPEAAEGRAKFFSIFVLHQNRDLGRGKNACVHESMIPEWMDLVVWGHEHECQIKPRESAVGTFRVTQPGSSVATSLVEGEARPKHVGLVQIRGDAFRLEPIPLTMVRPFAVDDIVLADIETLSGALNADDADSEIAEALAEKVEAMIAEARATALEPRFPDQATKIVHPEQVLVRLRVDHTGFAMVNSQRFGGRFVGKVANPSTILHFTRAKKVNAPAQKTAKGTYDAPPDEDELDSVQIKDLVRSQLEAADKKLSLLAEPLMNEALEDFVHKSEAQAFSELVEDQLKKTQRDLSKNKDVADEDAIRGMVEQRTTKARRAAGMREEETGDDDEAPARPKAAKPAAKAKAAAKSRKHAMDESDEDEDEEEEVQPKKRTRKAPKAVDLDDLDDEDDEPAPPPKKTAAKPAAKPAARKAAAKAPPRYDDDDMDDDDEPPKKPAAKKMAPIFSRSAQLSPARRSGRATTKKVDYAAADAGSDEDAAADVDATMDDDDIVDDDDVEDSLPPPPKKKRAPVATKKAPAAKAAPASRAPARRVVPWTSNAGPESAPPDIIDVSGWDEDD